MTDTLKSDQGDTLHHETDSENINILRERTFTPELRSLVSRISRNEVVTGGSEKETGESAPEDMGPNELLKALHSLFYEVKYMEELQNLHPAFHRTLFFDYGGSKDSRQRLLEIMTSIDSTLKWFALYAPDVRQKASLPAVLVPETPAGQNMIIGFHDPVFSALSEKIYILTADADTDVSKSLFQAFFDDNPGGSVTFIDIDSFLLEGPDNDSLSSHEEKSSPLRNSLFLALFSGGEPPSRELLIETLRGEGMVPLLLLMAESRQESNQFASGSHSLEDIVTEFDMLYQVARRKKNSAVAVIRAEAGQQNLALLSFIATRLRKLVEGEKHIIDLWPGTLVLFLSAGDIALVEIVLKEMNSLFDDAFTLTRFEKDTGEGILPIMDVILT